jgi:leucyl-tRNA synthetase
MEQYDHKKIEKKWQAFWEKKKLYEAADPKVGTKDKTDDANPKKFYSLIEFPYPSGDGLHVGHPRPYIGMDVISRKRRMEGYNVLYPIGWDAFGLPTENYAIKTGKDPRAVTKENSDTFRRQIQSLGISFDWSREINTTDPAYYKWTQWIFLQFLKAGLAYKKKMTINWCPKDLIGLANEEVIDGKCERCGTPVEKREREQWMLAITKYADKLLAGLDATKPGTPLIEVMKGEFASRPDKPTVPRSCILAIIRHWEKDEYLCLTSEKHGWTTFVIGGIEKGEGAVDCARREIAEETGYTEIAFIRKLGDPVFAKHFAPHKDVNRLAEVHGFYFELNGPTQKAVDAGEADHQKVVWISRADMEKTLQPKITDWVFWQRFEGKDDKDISFTVPPQPLLDWPASIKDSQRNWIGKSEGAEIEFALNVGAKKIKVFTTRPDTLFGVTYIVLAPEQEMVSSLLSSIENKKEVEEYIARAKKETDIERTDAKREKTGVELKGVQATNPVNGEKVSVWIADYVLADYGTGAVMAVPAHDERDWDFAKKYNLPVRYVIAPYFLDLTENSKPRPGVEIQRRMIVVALVRHPSENKFLMLDWKNGWTGFITGGIENDEDHVQAALREIKEETGYVNLRFVKKLGGSNIADFYAPHKKLNQHVQTYGLYFELIDESQEAVSEEEKAKHTIKWIPEKDVFAFIRKGTPMGDSRYSELFWNRLKTDNYVWTGDGRLIDSKKFTGLSSENSKKKITEAAGGTWVTKFKLRDWVFSRQRYWGEPIPVVHCEKCGIVPLPEKDLPLKLPEVKNYKPTETGESPLAAISKWVNTKCPNCKGPAKRETDTMPNWAGSSWYYLRYTDPKNGKAFAAADKLKYWTPVDWYNGGMEHTTLHLLYSRFWHKFLFDQGLVPTSEPYTKRTAHGLILAKGGEKMSKSKGNVVNPDGIVAAMGADALRLYEMFMGPFDQAIAWDENGIVGCRRFIERVWKLQEKIKTTENPAHEILINKTIKKVSEDIETMHFNTAVSTLMIAVNEFEKQGIAAEHYETLLVLLASFAPHVTEEIWQELFAKKTSKKLASAGGKIISIHQLSWPIFDPTKIKEATVTIPIQINGKTRATVIMSPDATEEEVKNMALSMDEISKWVAETGQKGLGKAEKLNIKKFIYVKGRLLNIVTDLTSRQQNDTTST